MARRRSRLKTKTRYRGGSLGGLPGSITQPIAVPPPGAYDPALDAEGRSSQRGLGYLLEDIGTGDVNDPNDQRYGVHGLRDLSDYSTAKTRAEQTRTRGFEDFGKALANIDLGFNRLANRQAQTQRAAGVLSGGAAQQAQEKRAFNKNLEVQPIETAKTRFTQDLDAQLGDLATGFGRRQEDRGTQRTRSTREALEFAQDLEGSKLFSARQTGWEPPPLNTRPYRSPRRRKRRK